MSDSIFSAVTTGDSGCDRKQSPIHLTPQLLSSTRIFNDTFGSAGWHNHLFQKMVRDLEEYALVLLDAEGTILTWNTGAQLLIGFEEKEIVGSDFRVFFTMEDRSEGLPESYLKSARENGNCKFDGWRVKNDGGKFWGSVLLSALRNDEDAIIGFSLVSIDLSESKAAEERQRRYNLELEHKNEELRRSEERYHKMISEVEDYAIILLDANGIVQNWNKGAESIKGYTANEIIGHHFSRFYLEADIRKNIPDSLLDVARQKGKASHEGWRLKKNGSTFWGSVVITALHGTENEIIGFSKVTRDLTERKMAEERQHRYALELQYKNAQLRRSEERYHRMIAEVEDYAIIMMDTQGRILNWNRGAEKIKGYAESEVLGQHFGIFYTYEDQRAGLPQHLLDIARTSGKSTHEGWRIRKDGTLFWASVVITSLHDESKAIIGFSKVTRDLTTKKKADEQIQLQNQQLEEYAYVASHDLQEPLRKIQMFSYLLKESPDNKEEVMRNIDRIVSASERMSMLINDVLNYAQATDDEDFFEQVDLNLVLQNVRKDFDLLLAQKEAVLEVDELPVLHAIPIQMHQLFSNLISNALKFSDKPPLIRVYAENDATGKVTITVEDNGIGLDPVYEEKIFKRFQRANTEKKGTGIGLALCKKIVENHGGTIAVKSELNLGTRFLLSFDLIT